MIAINTIMSHWKSITSSQEIRTNEEGMRSVIEQALSADQFRFEIGQTVRHVAGWQSRLFVVSRFLEQCHGGIQRHYSCRQICLGMPDDELVRFTEIELQPLDDNVEVLA